MKEKQKAYSYFTWGKEGGTEITRDEAAKRIRTYRNDKLDRVIRYYVEKIYYLHEYYGDGGNENICIGDDENICNIMNWTDKL